MRALRLSVTAFLAVAATVALVAAGCGDGNAVWICLNPITGKDDPTVYDPTHYVNGVFDPCHCYDPGGPSKSCPIVVPTYDAGSD